MQEEERRQSGRTHLEKPRKLANLLINSAGAGASWDNRSVTMPTAQAPPIKGVPAGSRDACMQEAAAPRGGDDMAD